MRECERERASNVKGACPTDIRHPRWCGVPVRWVGAPQVGVLPEGPSREASPNHRRHFSRTANFFEFSYLIFSRLRKSGMCFSFRRMEFFHWMKNLAKKIDKKNPWAIAPRKHRKILELLRAGVSIRETSRVVGVGIRTVQRRKAILDGELVDSITEEDGETAIAFRSARWRCPVHGWVEVRPCVMCTTLAAMNAAARERGGGTLRN